MDVVTVFVLFLLAVAALFYMAYGMDWPADVRSPPEGRVILTLAGNVEAPSKIALDPVNDPLFKKFNISFARAVQYDADRLSRLAQHELPKDPPRKTAIVYKGPLLRTVLADAGASYAVLQVWTIEGLARTLTAAEVARHEWILAGTEDGRALGIGDRGPLILMPEPANHIEYNDQDRQRWLWGVFYIEAK